MSEPLRANVAVECQRLGYVLLGRLGSGAAAEVFEARHRPSGRRVALKLSRPDLPESPLIVSRMQTEWSVGRGLRHPHLVTIYDGGLLSDGRAWLAMERLVGHDLQSELDASGPLPPARAVHIIRQLCEALEVLHRRGAVHRDVKPENIFLIEDAKFGDWVKLVDLGILALSVDDPERRHDQTGQFILGTPLYLAPEQARGHDLDARTDLYAVGGVLYHLLAGAPPFGDGDPLSLVKRHVEEPAPPLAVPGLPLALVSLVHRCLEKDPALRPASAAEVARALDAIAAELSPPSASRDASLPALPPAGRSAEWRGLVQHLARMVDDLSLDEPAVVEARAAAAAAETLSVSARETALLARVAADEAARQRIEARVRLASRSRALGAASARLQERRRAAQAQVDEAISALDAHDESFAEAMTHLRGLVAPTARGIAPDAFEAAQRELQAILSARPALALGLKRARDAEESAEEAVAALLAEELDLNQALAELELAEQEDGAQREQAAARASDARAEAERALEASAVQLLGAVVRALLES